MFARAPNYAGGGMVPASNYGMDSFSSGNLASGLTGLFGGMFGNSGAPYEDAMGQYKKYAGQSAGYQKPFFEAGQAAIPQYQNWLGSMKDPSGFINNLMSGYQESPWAKFQQQQGVRTAQNMGSATGLSGSTPLMQFAQQNAGNIASGDMQNWLSNVLGINTQYGAGVGGLMNTGQTSANALSKIYSDLGSNMGEQTYNRGAAEGNDLWNMIGGGATLASMFL